MEDKITLDDLKSAIAFLEEAPEHYFSNDYYTMGPDGDLVKITKEMAEAMLREIK